MSHRGKYYWEGTLIESHIRPKVYSLLTWKLYNNWLKAHIQGARERELARLAELAHRSVAQRWPDATKGYSEARKNYK
jgi:hypothetical protein